MEKIFTSLFLILRFHDSFADNLISIGFSFFLYRYRGKRADVSHSGRISAAHEHTQHQGRHKCVANHWETGEGLEYGFRYTHSFGDTKVLFYPGFLWDRGIAPAEPHAAAWLSHIPTVSLTDLNKEGDSKFDCVFLMWSSSSWCQFFVKFLVFYNAVILGGYFLRLIKVSLETTWSFENNSATVSVWDLINNNGALFLLNRLGYPHLKVLQNYTYPVLRG